MSTRSFFRPARRIAALGLSLAVACAPVVGCAAQATGSDSSDTVATDDVGSSVGVLDAKDDGSSASLDVVDADEGAVNVIDVDDLFSKRDLDPSYDEATATVIELTDTDAIVTGKGVTVEGPVITITSEGTYVLRGSLSNGQVIVDADGQKVQLVLDGCNVTCQSSAALYVRQAKKVFVTLAADSSNKLATTEEFVAIDDNNIDGAVFSKDDLTINGSGTLEVTCAGGHGIVVKDDLVLAGGNVSVTATRHAIQAKDSVAVTDGVYTLSAGTDGIHAENDDDAEKGYIYVGGGTLTITADSDGIDANSYLQVDGGKLAVDVGDDGLHAELDLVVNGGCIDVSSCYEGLEGARVTVTGGAVGVVASDDGLNAVGNPTEATSDVTVGGTQPNGGFQPGEMPQPNGDFGPSQLGDGEMPEPPASMRSHDGAGPDDSDAPGSGLQGGPRAGRGLGDFDGMPGGSDTAYILITGGTITIDAQGDGIDSNGDLTVTGGEVYISGPTSGADGALDYEGEAIITGGVVVAAGSTGMAVSFGSSSTQGSMLVSASGSAGDAITLVDSSGNILATYTPTKAYGCVAVSAPGVEKGGTYTITCGSTSTEVTLDVITYTDVPGFGGGMHGFGGGPGMGGQSQGEEGRNDGGTDSHDRQPPQRGMGLSDQADGDGIQPESGTTSG